MYYYKSTQYVSLLKGVKIMPDWLKKYENNTDTLKKALLDVSGSPKQRIHHMNKDIARHL